MDQYKEAYDRKCKSILSYKIVLAKIMKECVDEYKDYDFTTIMNCIEYENSNDKIVGITNDLNDIKYDVFYKAKIPNSEESMGAFINIEAQKTAKLKYKIHNRALFYAANEITYQYNRVFKNQEYDNLQKVVTIWICFDAPSKEEENSITYFSIFKDVKVGYNVVTKEEYEKLLIVVIYLGEDSSQNEFLRFLEVLFTNQLTVDEKKRILEDEYQIPVDHKMEGELDSMCNLSDRIEERALEKGKRQGIKLGIEQGIEREKINSVVTLIQNSHLSFEEAIKLLNLPEHLIDTCRKYVIQEMNA